MTILILVNTKKSDFLNFYKTEKSFNCHANINYIIKKNLKCLIEKYITFVNSI